MTVRTLAWVAQLARQDGTSVEVRFDGGDEPRMRACFGGGFHYVPQGPGNLGARMTRAIDEAFDAGVGAVVIVGTDCPEITTASVRSAFEVLEANDLALGPTQDGGYYLIGLRRPVAQLFSRMAWGTDAVFEETVQRARQLGLSYGVLQTLRDVDRPGDLDVWHRARTHSDARRGSTVG